MIVLKKLYEISNNSGKEKRISKAIQTILHNKSIKFNVDKHGQIFYFKKNTPLISCHLDSVFSTAPVEIKRKKGCLYGIDRYGALTGLGADDKNGIWIMLKMLDKYRNNISFVFSVQEESGGTMFSKLLENNSKIVESMKYCIVLDRKGSSDIIGTTNYYCDSDFEDEISDIGKTHCYKPASGLFSDADRISEYLNTVNLSVGYFNPHSIREYTHIESVYNALIFTDNILHTVEKSFGKPKKREYGDFWSSSTDWDDWTYTLNEDDMWENGGYCTSCGQDFLSSEDICALADNNWDCLLCNGKVTSYSRDVSEYKKSKEAPRWY